MHSVVRKVVHSVELMVVSKVVHSVELMVVSKVVMTEYM